MGHRTKASNRIFTSTNNATIVNTTDLKQAKFDTNAIAFKIKTKEESHILSVLNETHSKLITTKQQSSKHIESTLNKLAQELNRMASTLAESKWEMLIKQILWQHPILKIMHQDPSFKRSFEKPRGYAGDAVLLDYFYTKSAPFLSKIGKQIFKRTVNRPSAIAVRNRAELIASYIDKTADTKKEPRILSIACGHLREALMSQAIINNRIAELVAIDHDLETLNVIKHELTPYRITPIHHSIFSLIKGREKNKLGQFDFAYSAGLFDYLSDRMGQALTKYMFDLLKPNGTLLITNFSANNPDRGYMEAFMDWKLIYRNQPEIESLAKNIPNKLIKSKKAFKDANNTIIYLEIIKRCSC